MHKGYEPTTVPHHVLLQRLVGLPLQLLKDLRVGQSLPLLLLLVYIL
jgi:hypothetical protein